MTDLRKFIFCLFASFGLPWLLVIVAPALKYQSLSPIAYDKEADGEEGYYPKNTVNGQGYLVYAREGCVQCHTQMIRPPQLGLDAWRQGWGQDQEPRPAEPVRPTEMIDYLGEDYAFLGVQRNGPDLANAGWRFSSREELHRKLYAPQSVHDWSTMPPYTNLYTVQLVQGERSEKALDLPAGVGPGKKYEVVPTSDAEDLVDYILSLKRDFPLPSGKGAIAASAGDTAANP